MKKILHDFFTGPTSEYFEAGRFLWFVSIIAAIAYSGFHLFVNETFDIMEFGAGIAALLAAGGWGIGAKDKAAKEAKQ